MKFKQFLNLTGSASWKQQWVNTPRWREFAIRALTIAPTGTDF
jgi:hypothetical protein